MTKDNLSSENQVIERLSILQKTPSRNPEFAKRGRAAFLNKAQLYQKAVSQQQKSRPNGWIGNLKSLLFIQKERKQMFNVMAIIMVILTAVIGGSGATVAAAQSSLPDQPLYGIKILSEEIRSDLTLNDQYRYELALQYSERRIEEMHALLQKGVLPTETLQQRLQTQLDLAIKAAVQQQDQTAASNLLKLQTMLQAYLQIMEKDQQTIQQRDQLMQAIQIKSMLNERLQLVQQGILDPNRLRNQNLLRNQLNIPSGQVDPTETSPVDNTKMDTTGLTSSDPLVSPVTGNELKNSQSGNPWTTGTPTPGSGYGPGTNTEQICTPNAYDWSGTNNGQQEKGPENSSSSGNNKK